MRIRLCALLLLAPGIAAAQEIERINPAGMTRPAAYTHVVRYGELLFVAGQVALDADGNVVGENDMRRQFRQALENLRTVLASQGADFDDIVKTTIFTTDIDALRSAGDVRDAFWQGNAPANTLVQIERLARPELLVEIEAIAIAPDTVN